MKAVTAHLVAAVELVGEGVQVSALRQGLVERRVEDGDLRQARPEQLPGGLNAFDVGRVVQRRQLDHVFDAVEHFVGDEDGVREALAAMHDAVADGVNVGD